VKLGPGVPCYGMLPLLVCALSKRGSRARQDAQGGLGQAGARHQGGGEGREAGGRGRAAQAVPRHLLRRRRGHAPRDEQVLPGAAPPALPGSVPRPPALCRASPAQSACAVLRGATTWLVQGRCVCLARLLPVLAHLGAWRERTLCPASIVWPVHSIGCSRRPWEPTELRQSRPCQRLRAAPHAARARRPHAAPPRVQPHPRGAAGVQRHRAVHQLEGDRRQEGGLHAAGGPGGQALRGLTAAGARRSLRPRGRAGAAGRRVRDAAHSALAAGSARLCSRSPGCMNQGGLLTASSKVFSALGACTCALRCVCAPAWRAARVRRCQLRNTLLPCCVPVQVNAVPAFRILNAWPGVLSAGSLA